MKFGNNTWTLRLVGLRSTIRHEPRYCGCSKVLGHRAMSRLFISCLIGWTSRNAVCYNMLLNLAMANGEYERAEALAGLSMGTTAGSVQVSSTEHRADEAVITFHDVSIDACISGKLVSIGRRCQYWTRRSSGRCLQIRRNERSHLE